MSLMRVFVRVMMRVFVRVMMRVFDACLCAGAAHHVANIESRRADDAGLYAGNLHETFQQWR